MRQINAIKKLCQILLLPDPGSLSYDSDKIPVLTLKSSNEKITGFVTILQYLMEVSKNNSFAVKKEDDLEQSLLVNQWVEYGNLFVHTISMSDDKHLTRALLDELNNYLAIRSYLVGETITVADLVVFFFIQDTMKYLTYLEKERYLNLSRWYNHIQQLDFAEKKKEKQINLSTTYLVGWATGTHA